MLGMTVATGACTMYKVDLGSCKLPLAMQTLMGSIIAIGVWENKGGKALNLKLLWKVHITLAYCWTECQEPSIESVQHRCWNSSDFAHWP